MLPQGCGAVQAEVNVIRVLMTTVGALSHIASYCRTFLLVSIALMYPGVSQIFLTTVSDQTRYLKVILMIPFRNLDAFPYIL